MFELSVALKYLIPRRKQLSVSLIALMSVTVISLVVWLVLVFLSVTEGIEKSWLAKLTSLNAPLRILPTKQYYSSYYYLADSHSADSSFATKNIAQKAYSEKSDPYCPETDPSLPSSFPSPVRNAQGELIDPVKEAYRILGNLEQTKGQTRPDFVYQDFEISGSLMRLQMLRPDHTQNFLTQVSYLASVPDRSPSFASMLLPPTEKDVNHLFFLSSHSTEYAREDAPSLKGRASGEKLHSRVKELLSSIEIKELRSTTRYFKLPSSLLAENTPFQCSAVYQDGQIVRLLFSHETQKSQESRGKMWRSKEGLFFEKAKGDIAALEPRVPLFVEGPLRLNVLDTLVPKETNSLTDIRFTVQTVLQGTLLSGEVPWENLQVSKADFSKALFSITEEKETGVLLAKSYRDNGVLIGDRGYLSYHAATPASVQEQRLPIFVAGFYDPGILSVGNRCILVPPFVVQTINASNSTFNLDKTQSNGILVWFNDVSKAEEMKKALQLQFASAGISSFWEISTFREYDFAKDLLQQFQSDKYLFSLIAAIILLVACCNIISLLTLLVNDKKKEIGILQAMGTSTWSIALIFGTCGIIMGVISCLIGAGAAVLTLKHIDTLVHVLSSLQGRDAFNAAFFGSSLPNVLSHGALKFIFLITPLLSLLAGLVPAVKACRLRPSEILRSE